VRALAASMLLIAGCATTPDALTEAQLETYPDARGMPADVQHFIVRHGDCSHWLGEPEWDAGRRRQIEEAIVRSCFGIDAYGRRMRARYAGNAEVMARLRDYEPLGH
jgi:hypothetical protein